MVANGNGSIFVAILNNYTHKEQVNAKKPLTYRAYFFTASAS